MEWEMFHPFKNKYKNNCMQLITAYFIIVRKLDRKNTKEVNSGVYVEMSLS